MASNRNIAQELINKHNIPVQHGRYREDGKWYHHLRKFPSAFLDSNGYVIFNSKEEYQNCVFLQFGQDVNIPKGISAIPGYKAYRDGTSISRPKSNVQVRKATFSEGGTQEIVLELQKRDPKLKSLAIEKYGLSCQVCEFDFEKVYGEFGKGYIEMHHLVPLGVSKEERINTVDDVAVVCSNCHRVLHRNGKEPIPIEQLKAAVNKQKNK
ncbi:MAG: hypothetical protein C4531_10370 [Desulfurivibrio sp.]|nr:MAG: hypothetical protein C4531_10370 [Desulfurivibrio sp.]